VGLNVGGKRKSPRAVAPAPKVVIYVEVDPALKEQFERYAKLHNRKLTGEVTQALQEYLAKLGPAPEPGSN
jgi:hypothetical protein